MPCNTHFNPFIEALLVFAFVILPIRYYANILWSVWKARPNRHPESPLHIQPQVSALLGEDAGLIASSPKAETSHGTTSQLLLYKDLYHKLHNLEQFPGILPSCRDILIKLLTKTLQKEHENAQSGILSIQTYTRQRLTAFLQNEHDAVTEQWRRYLAQRRSGRRPELFTTREEAIWWLKQLAPVKFVDGAWLGNVNKIITPFPLRHVTKDAWQVMAEELGNGDVQKNHVHVYRELMREIDVGLPDADSIDFVHPRHGLDESCVWEAAIAQLLISLFPQEFLPEILGFNLQFEALTLETMIATKEIEEFGFNPYYFLLHVSIDNADSGHTAIALEAVMKYLDLEERSQGTSMMNDAWRRVQAGYILSKQLSAGPGRYSVHKERANCFSRTLQEEEVAKIFKAKASVAHKIHCRSRMKLGGRRLDDWLEPHAFAGIQWQMDFLQYLSNMKPWIRKGDSSNSKLVQELSWQGRMFGSFTQKEVEAVKRWIDGLVEPLPITYWSFVNRVATKSEDIICQQDVREDYPVFVSVLNCELATQSAYMSLSPFQHLQPSIKTLTTPDLSRLFPLWFTSPCVLESFVCIPAKTTTLTASSIVRLLRAQYGFYEEGPGVDGVDEANRTDSIGLVELGLEMVNHSGALQPASLKDILDKWPSEFALKMLHLSMRPMENFGLLLGLAWAFVGLHHIMASSMLLSASSRHVCTQIVRRERECLNVCFEEMKDDKVKSASFHRGYGLGTAEIEYCFGTNM